MKSSNRQPRYRRRFLTLASRSRSQLQRLTVDLNQSPHLPDSPSVFRALLNGLCVKSAQEIGASPEGISRARNRASMVMLARREDWEAHRRLFLSLDRWD